MIDVQNPLSLRLYSSKSCVHQQNHWLDLQALEQVNVAFSSYAGMLVSTDDFYILGNGMAMEQTSLNVLNTTIYDELTPKSLMAWQRVRLANTLGRDAAEWASVFGEDNSGTYNNQYIVIDLNKYVPPPKSQSTPPVFSSIEGMLVGCCTLLSNAELCQRTLSLQLVASYISQ